MTPPVEKILAEPGEVHVVPAGDSHRTVNRHQGAAAGMFGTLRHTRCADEVRKTLWGPADDGHTNRKGCPRVLRAAFITREFDEFALTQPPKWVQDLVFGLPAPLARALNHQGTYVPLDRRPSPRCHS